MVLFLLTTQPSTVFYISITWVILVIILLWYGSRFISNFLDKKLPWKIYVTKRFFIQLGLTILYYVICLNGTYFIFKIIFTEDPPDFDQVMVMNFFGLLILPIFSIYFGIHFLKAWRKSELETEQLQKEGLKSQLEALKNHLDPHFLFNNLNILSSLIDTDTSLSKAYLEKFAEVYRIILQNEVSELITLGQELDFIQSYLYLIKIRFQEDILVDMDVENSLKQHYIPPLCIQMLIENCIKHNAITETSPLNIKIYTEDDRFIVVENNLKPKRINQSKKSSGLQNIRNRYDYFTTEQITVDKSDKVFKVKLPLIELEEV